MKVDILTHGDPSKFFTVQGAYLGGGVGFVSHLINGLKPHCDINVVVNGGPIRKDADVYLLTSIGVNEERNDKGKADSDLKYKQLSKVDGRKFAVLHGVAEFRFYKYSFEHFKKMGVDKLILTAQSPAVIEAVRTNLPGVEVVVIPMPYTFDEKRFGDRSDNKGTVISPARIAAAKCTGKILDLAAGLPKLKFLMCGLQQGMYWHYGMEQHPHVHANNVDWIGPRKDVYPSYQSAALSIDLTTFWLKKNLEGQRTQYTTLEAVDCGCIPVTWDCWDNGTWKGVFLPSPHKEGNRIVWDAERCIELIKEFRYDPEVARYNLESLKKRQNEKVIGAQYMREFTE